MPSSWRVYEQDDNKEWQVVESGVHAPPLGAPPDVARKFREVFLTPFYMSFERFHFARPSFGRGADLCLQHWQKKGDVDFIEHLANTPSLVLKADTDLEIKSLGSRKVVRIPVDGELEWLVIDPKGVGATKESIAHLEEHIREVFNQPRKLKGAAGRELVGVRLMDETESMTRAQMWAVGIAQSITQCLDHLAWWLGLPSGGVVTFPEDALEKLSDPQGFDDVIAMGKSRLLSKAAVQREAVRYGKLDEDHDIEVDLEALAAEAPALPDFGGADDEGGDES